MSGPLLRGWGGGLRPLPQRDAHFPPWPARGSRRGKCPPASSEAVPAGVLLANAGHRPATPRGQAKEGQELRLRGDPRGEVRSAWALSPGLSWAGGDVAISQRSREGSGIPGWHRRGFGDGGVTWGPLD